MRTSTTALMTVGAVTSALAAATLTVNWLASQAHQPQPLATPEPSAAMALTTIVVAARPLPFGTMLSADALKEVSWPKDALPPGAFQARDSLIAEARTAIASIAENEPILQSRVTAPGQRAALSALISDGMTAVTVRVDDVLGVAGFVQPDDRVDVLLTKNDRQPIQAPNDKSAAFSDTLLQNVRVLAIDQGLDRATEARPAKAVTLEVTPSDAQKVMLAATVGQLSLTLRGMASDQRSATRRIGLGDLPGSAAPEMEGDGSTVTVTRGVDRRRYEVHPELEAYEQASEQTESSGQSVSGSEPNSLGLAAASAEDRTAPAAAPR